MPDSLETWKDHHIIFSCLWKHWQCPGDGNGPSPTPSWPGTARPELGIHPTELLATVSWMIMDEGADEDDGPADPGPPSGDGLTERDRYRGLIRRAERRAAALRASEPARLLDRFLAKFQSMNALVNLRDEEETFEQAAVVCLQCWAEAVLEVEPGPIGRGEQEEGEEEEEEQQHRQQHQQDVDYDDYADDRSSMRTPLSPEDDDLVETTTTPESECSCRRTET
jgi:hypothetical protein